MAPPPALRVESVGRLDVLGTSPTGTASKPTDFPSQEEQGLIEQQASYGAEHTETALYKRPEGALAGWIVALAVAAIAVSCTVGCELWCILNALHLGC